MEEILSRECERANSYKLLLESYYLPDENLIKMLSHLAESSSGLYSEFAGNIPGMDEIESLKVDYSKLFVGPYKLLAPPYGSVYLENGKLMGDSTMDVRKWYSAEGLNITLREVPDHIALELEFMYFLISKEIEAINNSDSEKAIYYLEKQGSFLETHLGAWVSAFAESVRSHAKTEFYRDLSHATESFVRQDLKDLCEFLSTGL